jgi:hypothetical protein
MMNWNDVVEVVSPNSRFFSWMNSRKPHEIVGRVGVTPETHTRHLLNTSKKHHHVSQLAQFLLVIYLMAATPKM